MGIASAGLEGLPEAGIRGGLTGSICSPCDRDFMLQILACSEWNRYQQFRSGFARANFKLSTMLANAFPHTRESHAHMRAPGPEMLQFFRGDSDSVVADVKHGAAIHHVEGNIRPQALRVTMDVGERFLQHPEQYQFHGARQSADFVGNFRRDLYAAPL